jgi:hypothetical protein
MCVRLPSVTAPHLRFQRPFLHARVTGYAVTNTNLIIGVVGGALLVLIIALLLGLRLRRRRSGRGAPPLLPHVSSDVQSSSTADHSSTNDHSSLNYETSVAWTPRQLVTEPTPVRAARREGPPPDAGSASWIPQLQPQAVAGPSHVVSPEAEAARNVVTQNEKGEIVLGYQDPHEADAMRQLQHHAFDALAGTRREPTPRLEDVPRTPAPVMEVAAEPEDVHMQVAALQGEIHRLRAALIVRTEEQDTPPAYH